MSTPTDRRTRKRLATRQAISDTATRLFFERGFDAVTLDEIAKAADVGRMTIFNHFPRKEDLFFDLEDDAREAVREAFRLKDDEKSAIETLRVLAHRLVEEQPKYLSFSNGSRRWVETIEASEPLKARARAIRDDLVQLVADNLAERVGQSAGDPAAQLAAHMLMAAYAVALIEAHRTYRASHDVEAAKATFLAIVNSGTAGVTAAVNGSPYV